MSEKEQHLKNENKEENADDLNSQPEQVDDDDVKPVADNVSKEFSITILRKEIEEKFERSAEKYSTEMKIDGFRKGKIPLDVVKTRYRDVIIDEVINTLIEDYTFKSIREQKLPIISSPVIKEFKFEEGEDLQATVSVDLMPDVVLPDLNKIEIKIDKEELKTEKYDEEKQIERILENNKKRQIVKERVVQDGDFIEFGIQSRFSETKRMLPKKDAFFEMKNEPHPEFGNIYGFFMGKESGKKFEFEMKYDENFPKKNWAGKSIKHFIEVRNIFEYLKPEFNKEFLKSMGFEDEKAFRNKLKEEYEHHENRHRDQIIITGIREKLLELCHFDIPGSLIDREVHSTYSQYNHIISTLPEDKRTEYIRSLKENAEKSIRFSFIIEEVKNANNITIDDKELEKELKSIAEINHIDIKDVRKYYTNKEHKESLIDSIGRQRAMDLLKEKIKVKEV